MGRLRRHLTYANVMATIAVALAVGGAGAYAASKLGKNVVRSRNIAPNAVKTSDIAKNAVKRGKIAGGAIDDSRLANGSVGTNKLVGGAVTTGKLASASVSEGILAPSVQTKLNAIQAGGIVRVDASNGLESAAPAYNLIQRGPFTVYAKCFTGGGLQARVYVASSAAGALKVGGGAYDYPGGSASGYLNPNTPENKRIIGQSGLVIPSGGGTLTAGASLIFGATNIQVVVAGFVKGAEVASDVNNYGGGGSRCLFSSYVINAG
ncbi:MAG TPA: hypothetical protein VHQ97_07710 [Solirubrobacterales bacterium]|nr:hypothetical protein [Solirubrobacterales bacterium]